MLIDIVREWVGSEPTDTVILEVLGRYRDDPFKAALSILRRRYADLVAEPASWDIKDDYGQSTRDNIAALRAQIRRLEDITEDEDAIKEGWQSVPIVGPDLSRR